MLPLARLWTGNTWVPAARLNQNSFVDDDDDDGDVNGDGIGNADGNHGWR